MSRRESFAERRERRAAVDDPQVVLEAAGRFLEARSRSVTEVRRRLTSAGYRPELVDGAVARLLEFGMLDDATFARTWVESRDRARPRGERAIRSELIQRGVEREIIDTVLEDRRTAAMGAVGGGTNAGAAGSAANAGGGTNTGAGSAATPDRLAAERLVAKHERALARVADPRRRRQRAYALLARHGFDPETCREVAAAVTTMASGADLDPPDDGIG